MNVLICPQPLNLPLRTFCFETELTYLVTGAQAVLPAEPQDAMFCVIFTNICKHVHRLC